MSKKTEKIDIVINCVDCIDIASPGFYTKHGQSTLESNDKILMLIKRGFLGWKSRTKFRDKYITPLIKQGLLSMTILNKPKSSKQKYQLTEEGLKALTVHTRKLK